MITLKNKNCIEYVSSGHFRSDGKWCHPERIIDTWEIIFLLSGNVYIQEGETSWELSENDVLLLTPGEKHFGYRFTENVSFYWVHFNASEIPAFKQIRADNSFSLKIMFSQLMHFSNTVGYSRSSLDLTTALIIEEIYYISSLCVNKSTVLASEIKEYIRLNVSNAINVSSVAKHFGYHENYIGQVFKNAFGKRMKDYITEEKIKKSQDLLNNTLYTAKEIGYIMGFSNENNFVKFFKYHTNMTPTEYRNIYTNTHINNK